MRNFSYINLSLFLLFTCFELYSKPLKFEVWFLGIDRQATYFLDLERMLNPNNSSFFVAVNEAPLQCQKVGEYCFDPQRGLYKPEDSKQSQVVSDVSNLKIDWKPPQKTLSTLDEKNVASSVDRQMINCEKTNYFDIFCGKAKKEEQVKTGFEIWIDTSSSMKQVDFQGHDKTCFRENFLKSLKHNNCLINKNYRLHGFDTTKKELGTTNSVCTNYGLNDMKKIQQAIEKSNAKHLLIITDIFEAHQDFLNYIESSVGGSHKGVDTPLYAKDILSISDSWASFCR